ncbi:MAG TPA: XRE family transcriptional regulator [Acidobacteriaceae bacterium]|jgi:predicted XRE-type DNA-binding protein|nr:XRE family transcriptional regulator [Acidobacteriaceae bacterium]
MSQSNHTTTGDVLDDLGFSRSEASALKIKATIVEAILAEIERRGFTQRQLVEVLDEYQPNVSNLLHGRISKVSIEKLLAYADRLRMRSSIELSPPVKVGRGKLAKHIATKESAYA